MTQNKAEERGFEPTIPMGVFLAVFGAVVAGAALLDMSFSNKMINLISGGLLLAIGAFCIALGRRNIKKRAKIAKEKKAD